MSNVTLTPDQAKIVMQCLDLAVKTGGLNAIQPTADSGSISVELLPATADGELANGSLVQKMTAPLTPEIMQAVPELAAAFAAVLAAIPATQAYLASQQEQPNE